MLSTIIFWRIDATYTAPIWIKISKNVTQFDEAEHLQNLIFSTQFQESEVHYFGGCGFFCRDILGLQVRVYPQIGYCNFSNNF